ncbi:homocysteine S-methyltransferase family protein [Faecalispora anaeroviscerum]|uniref:homocysteine S-methyltransferase family protein n=1 Tax=Faecalispora anaeroviscerum TaxID=2991836 RepID=UPI0024BA7214|nr:homocysteine S-methyltransferase family protein [Faecalispora anaeroviscerum]
MNVPWRLPFLLGGPAAEDFHVSSAGNDLSAEQWLLQNGELLRKKQEEWLSTGIGGLCAPTAFSHAFSPDREALREQVRLLNAGLLEITRQSAQRFGVPVGARVGGSGLFVPPYGEADFDDIYDGYRDQIRVLEQGGAEFILIENQSSMADMRAAVLASRTSDFSVFVTLSVDESGKTLTGCSLLPAVITLQAMGVEAIGLGGPMPPLEMLPLLKEVIPHASVPLCAIPSAEGLSPEAFAEQAQALLRAGVPVLGIGGDQTPAHWQALRQKAQEPFAFGSDYADADNYAAATENEAFFLGSDITLSEPIECSIALEEDLIDLDDEQVNAALIELNTLDDVMLLSQFGSVTRLPLAVHTDSRTILEAALRYVQGRLIVDTNCQIDLELIERTASKYGAIVY